MLAVRRFCLTGALVVSVAGCENQEPIGPSAARVGGVKAPSDVRARPTNSTTIQVTWIDNSTNEEGFRIERSGSGAGPWQTAGTTSANATSFDDGGRASEQQVCYRVVALRAKGESSTSDTDCTAPPAGPTNLAATAVDQQAVDLAWTDNSAVEDGYEVQRATAQGGLFSVVAQLAQNAAKYRDAGLSTGATYWYRVRPVRNGGGLGDFSNVASAAPTPGPPVAPAATNATPTFVGGVGITWIDRSTNEDGFRVERSFDAGATWVTVFPLRPNTTSLGDFYGAPSEQYVCYRVFAFNGLGDSPPSNTDCTTPPAGPSGLTATAVDQSIRLTWTDNSAVEDGYELKRATSYLGVYSVVADLPANSTVYTDLAVSSDTTYWYVVRANKDGGHSPYSDRVNGVAATARPAAPSGTVARPISSSTIGFYWTDNATNAEGFRVERSLDDGASWVIAGTTGAARYGSEGFLDDGRTSEHRVCYRVFAFNSQGDSPPSTTACATPPAAPTNITATWGEDGILIAWTDNSAVEDGYEVRVVGGEGYCAFSGELAPNSTSYLYWDPTGTCLWWVEVVALKDGGWSDTVSLYLSAASGSALSGAGVRRSRRP